MIVRNKEGLIKASIPLIGSNLFKLNSCQSGLGDLSFNPLSQVKFNNDKQKEPILNIFKITNFRNFSQKDRNLN